MSNPDNVDTDPLKGTTEDGGMFGQELQSAALEERQGFIRKVYAILTSQLILTFGFVLLVKSNETINNAVMDMWYLAMPAMFLQMAIWCTLACCIKVARKVPTNYIMLGIFTLCWTFILGWICSYYPAEVVSMAAGFTAAITVTLTAYACFTKTDFTKLCGPFVCIGLLLIIAVQLFLSLLTFFVFQFTQQWYPFAAGFCVILYGLFIIIDTQLIVGGGRHKLSIDDYIIGAMILYIDIIMLFLYLLEIFGRR